MNTTENTTAAGTPALTAKLTARLARVLEYGYKLDSDAPTGGGCRAMIVTAPDGRTCYLTNGDALLPGEDDALDVYLGYYDAADEEAGGLLVQGGVGVDLVHNVATYVAHWAKGDPCVDAD